MSRLVILNRILDILNQKIAMGQGEGGRMIKNRKGGVMFCDGGEMSSSESEIDEYDGGVMAGKRKKRCKKVKAGVMAGKKCKAGVMAGKRGQSSWICHVKAYQKKHGCTYSEALKKASASYKK